MQGNLIFIDELSERQRGSVSECSSPRSRGWQRMGTCWELGDRMAHGTGVWLLFLPVIAVIWMTGISSAPAGLVPSWTCHQPKGNPEITSQAEALQEEHKDRQCSAQGKAEWQGQGSEQLQNFSNSG